MKSPLFRVLCLLFLGLFVVPVSAQQLEAESPQHDLSGTWTVLLSNSLSRKQVTFQITEKDDRLRGHLRGRDVGELKLDGRREKDNKIKLWGTYYERTGKSWDYEFKGQFEGEPGKEKTKGESGVFRPSLRICGCSSKEEEKEEALELDLPEHPRLMAK